MQCTQFFQSNKPIILRKTKRSLGIWACCKRKLLALYNSLKITHFKARKRLLWSSLLIYHSHTKTSLEAIPIHKKNPTPNQQNKQTKPQTDLLGKYFDFKTGYQGKYTTVFKPALKDLNLHFLNISVKTFCSLCPALLYWKVTFMFLHVSIFLMCVVRPRSWTDESPHMVSDHVIHSFACCLLI